MECCRTANDHYMREMLWVHTFDKFVERLAEAALAVGHSNEGQALVL